MGHPLLRICAKIEFNDIQSLYTKNDSERSREVCITSLFYNIDLIYFTISSTVSTRLNCFFSENIAF